MITKDLRTMPEWIYIFMFAPWVPVLVGVWWERSADQIQPTLSKPTQPIPTATSSPSGIPGPMWSPSLKLSKLSPEGIERSRKRWEEVYCGPGQAAQISTRIERYDLEV